MTDFFGKFIITDIVHGLTIRYFSEEKVRSKIICKRQYELLLSETKHV
jgi:hypothetical protein